MAIRTQQVASAAAIVLADRGERTPDRCLTSILFAAFQHACDEGELEAAGQILRILEGMLARGPLSTRAGRRGMDELIAGYTRLWLLRHPEAGLAA
jgi:hypothetical protein